MLTNYTYKTDIDDVPRKGNVDRNDNAVRRKGLAYDVPRKGNVDRNPDMGTGDGTAVDVPRKGNVDRNPASTR